MPKKFPLIHLRHLVKEDELGNDIDSDDGGGDGKRTFVAQFDEHVHDGLRQLVAGADFGQRLREEEAGRRRGEASAGPSGRRIRRARPVVRRTPPGRPAATRPMGNERKSNGGSSDETASRNGGTFSAALPRRAATCRQLENSRQPSSGFFSTRE